MKIKSFRLFFVLFLVSACSSHSDTEQKNIVTRFKAKWKENFSGYWIRSRGPGVGLIVKTGVACQKDIPYRYYYDSARSVYSFKSDEKFIRNECPVDVHNSEIVQLIGLFDELSIYELIAIKNDYGIVQLTLSEREAIYYIGNKNLPMRTKEWLDEFSEQIDSNFYYVKGEETIWRNLPPN